MLCLKCGKQLEQDSFFCNNCGTRVEKRASYQQYQQVPPMYQTAAPPKAKNFAGIKILAALVVVISLFYIVGSLFQTGAKQDFTLHNNTGVDIHYIYISPVYSDDWEQNLIEGSVLYSGDSLPIQFPKQYADVQYWDMRVGDSYGEFLDWANIDLFAAKSILLYVDEYGDVYADIVE